MFFVIYGIGAAIWLSWELSSWSEYKERMDSVDFSYACLVSAAIWPVAILAKIFTYLRYHNDAP